MADERKGSVAEREAPPTALFWAKRTFGYGVRGHTERILDRGQVFRLEGLANDKLLFDLGYIAAVEPGAKPFACRACGAEFLDMGMRDGHGKMRHEERTFVPPPPPVREHGETKDAYQNRLDEWASMAGRMADEKMEQRDKLEDAIAPLDLTKTAASREA